MHGIYVATGSDSVQGVSESGNVEKRHVEVIQLHPVIRCLLSMNTSFMQLPAYKIFIFFRK
jgi:hypothetical protein